MELGQFLQLVNRWFHQINTLYNIFKKIKRRLRSFLLLSELWINKSWLLGQISLHGQNWNTIQAYLVSFKYINSNNVKNIKLYK